MDSARSFDQGFEAHVPQTASDVADALRTGLLSLDANVLLNFYRYSPTAREALVEVLKAAGSRVWVSHQAAREFWRNRCAAIDQRNEATEQLKTALDKNERSLIESVDSWAKQTAVSEDIKVQVREALRNGLGQARHAVEAETSGAGAISYSPSSDSVLDLLRDLLAANVGNPLDETEHSAALAEGQRRAEARIPPGYRDADKAENGGPDGASGDFLVWLQSTKEAVRRNLPLVIVTGDEKEDWWWRHRSSFMGPRAELVLEFASQSSERLYMLRPLQLIEQAAVLNVVVSPEAATDVARAEKETRRAVWTRAAVAELLLRLDAEGREQAEVIQAAAEHGGIITREEIYAIGAYDEDRQLKGFTRPSARITRALQDEGLLDEGVEPILTPDYGGGVTAIQFEIPLEVAEILSDDPDFRARAGR